LLRLGGGKTLTAAVSGFAAGDTIDLSSMKFGATEKLKYVQSGTSGTLTITEGTQKTTITLFGQYVAAGFHMRADTGNGTAITYSSAGAETSSTIHGGHG
jgi:hypothetical protein